MKRLELYRDAKASCAVFRDGAYMQDDAFERAHRVWVRAGRPHCVFIRWWHLDPETLKAGETIRIEPFTRRHRSIKDKAAELRRTA